MKNPDKKQSEIVDEVTARAAATDGPEAERGNSASSRDDASAPDDSGGKARGVAHWRN